MIRVHSFAAGPGLAHAVERYTVYSGAASPQEYERVFPNGYAELTINLKDGRLRCYDVVSFEQHGAQGLLLSGLQTRPYIIDTAQLTDLISVRLLPGGVWRLLGISADALAGRHTPVADILGTGWRAWEDQLQRAKSPGDRIAILETALLRRTGRNPHPAVQAALARIGASPAAVRVKELAREQGLSFRRFNALFQREVGVSAKQFARIRRFHGLLQELTLRPTLSWGERAGRHGYSDQPHLIREFEQFTGFTPSQFLRLRRASVEPASSIAPPEARSSAQSV